MSLLITIVVFLVMICVLVAAHELGHFLAARLFKMDVEEFAIGFGKGKLVWMKRGGTEYTLRPFPLGGFVRIKGMIPEEDGSEIHVPNGFYSKSPWQRWLVLFAGPLFSILFGVVVLTGLYSTVGKSKPVDQPVIGMVVKGGGADKAGIHLGDRILSIDGQPTNSFYDVLSLVREKPGTPVQIELERNGSRLQVTATPTTDKEPSPVYDAHLQLTEERKIQGKLGILYQTALVPLPLGEAFVDACKAPAETFLNLVGMVAQPSRAKDELGGPVSIAVITGEAVKQGLSTVVFLAAMLSISLGFMNLLPIPPFDGGQMIVAFVELLRKGRRLSMRVQEAVSTVGMVLVVAMVVGIFYLDFTRNIGGSDSSKPKTAQPEAAPSK